MTLAVPISIVAFGFSFWFMNHALHVQMRVAHDQIQAKRDARGGGLAFDRWMALSTAVLLLPLVPFFYFVESPLQRILAASLWPVFISLFLGQVRGLQSGSSILFQASHGAAASFLLWLYSARPDASSCVMLADSLQPDRGITVLGYCAEMTEFWINTWLTTTLAFAATYAATLIAMYAIDINYFGWAADPRQRQILAIVYSIAAIWILIEALVWLGAPLFGDLGVLARAVHRVAA
jgi:hypothetical protein